MSSARRQSHETIPRTAERAQRGKSPFKQRGVRIGTALVVRMGDRLEHARKRGFRDGRREGIRVPRTAIRDVCEKRPPFQIKKLDRPKGESRMKNVQVSEVGKGAEHRSRKQAKRPHNAIATRRCCSPISGPKFEEGCRRREQRTWKTVVKCEKALRIRPSEKAADLQIRLKGKRTTSQNG